MEITKKQLRNEKKKQYYLENPEMYQKHLETCRKWYAKNREKDLLDGYVWRMKNREKSRETERKRYINNPTKRKEQRALERINKAKNCRARQLAKAIPLKPCCEICGSKEGLEHHHWDYDKPLLVNTLCDTCHTIQRIKNFARWHQARLMADSRLMEVTNQN